MVLKMLFNKLIVILSILFLFACSSTPDDGETAEQKLAQAKRLRTIVIDYNLKEYGPTEYEKAETSYEKGESFYNAQNEKKAKKNLTTAISYYKIVYRKGLPSIAEQKEVEVREEKTKSDEIKAGVAMKEEYDLAVAKYDEAVQNSKEADYEESVTQFDEAKTMLEEVYTKTLEKKEKAEASMEESNKSMEELEEKARELEEDE